MTLYPWVEMIVLSELAAYGPLQCYAEPGSGPSEERFCQVALKYGLWLIPGSVFEKDNNVIYNTSVVIDPRGDVVARHRKLFPFRPYEHGVEPGDQFVVFDVPDAGRFGLCICYGNHPFFN